MSENLNESVPKREYHYTRYRQVNQQAGTSSDTPTQQALTWTESRTGVQNPRWKSQVQHLQSASTPYTRTGATSFSAANGSFRIELNLPSYPLPKNKNRYWESLSDDLRALPNAPGTSASAYNSALGSFLANVNSQTSPFKGMVFLSELKETLRMLRNPASGLRNGINSYLNRVHSLTKGQKAKLAAKTAADTWLEYVFGWKPLVGDIEDATEAYKKFIARSDVGYAVGEAFETVSSSQLTTPMSHANYLFYNKTELRKSTEKVKFRGAVRRHLNHAYPESAERVLQLCGFRWEEFVPTIWELIPYSFVVDYFTNIGDILNGYHALTADFIWASASRWRTSSVEIGCKADQGRTKNVLGARPFSLSESGGPMKATRVDYSRDVPSLAVPSIEVKIPGLGWEWANMLALGLTRLKL